ncbi:MAG: APC family permease [Bacillota bacterium]|nr:APC family permease [Bacillota bacterium]
MINVKDILLGKPLKNSDIKHEKLSKLWGLPIMASDAVSSVAYAGEEILLVLVPAIGMNAFGVAPLVTLPIILLLLILIFSYSQIIDHYPSGGGAYNVSKENLGKYPSLLAASSLVVDYIMTVAVSISSATAAITSAFPSLLKHTVPIALFFLALITLGNLRGIRESSKIFGMPTYIFIFSMAIMIVTGLIGLATGALHPIIYPESVTKSLTNSMTGLSLVLLLHAFASGCTALTGVEAVSNAIPNFKEPSQKNAKNILYMLGGVIIFIFGGTTILEVQLHVVHVEGVTVVSQIAQAVFGDSAFYFMYYIIQIFTALILILAANTAYNGLPLLLYILARDNYVPRQFAHRGTKLSFSNGIMFIFIIASLLMIQFRADTHRLIPLYTIGVFISFTLSQYGMVKRWLRTKENGWQHKMWINAFGALMTFIGTCVVVSIKFKAGAWMVIIAIPIIMAMMIYVNNHYSQIAKELELKDFNPYYKNTGKKTSQCIVLVQTINKSLLKSLNYANTISDNITALHVCRHPEHAEELRKQWDSLNIPVKLEIVLTQYQDIIKPFNEYIKNREANLGHGENLSVIIIKFVTDHWYDSIMHNQTTYFLEKILSKHKNVSSIIMPFHYNPGKMKSMS